MTDFRTLLASLRRPRLLIRAARFGLADYRRDRDLRRLLDAAAPRPSTPCRRCWRRRNSWKQPASPATPAYSVARHIEVLIALMAEARLLPRGLTACPAT